MVFVEHQQALDFIKGLPDNSVNLLLTDPPYMGILTDSWDNQWKTVKDYVDWFYTILEAAKPKMREDGSVVFFGGVGKHGERPFFSLLSRIEDKNLYHYRNLITWGKRRAYGKSHDYLFCREEIVWYSVSPERTKVTFNVPLLDVKRGYKGFNKSYPAKSDYKRVSNVWTDIPELMRPERQAQKPIPLMERLINTHSNPDDLVIDPFTGYGSTGIAALGLNRRFLGCEAIKEDAEKANKRCEAVAKTVQTPQVVKNELNGSGCSQPGTSL